jgi:hypothetical protein
MIFEPPLPISIQQDWTKVRDSYNKIVRDIESGELEHASIPNPQARNTIYDLGNLGRVHVAKKLTVNPWYIWKGSYLESMLPWLNKFKQHLATQNIWFDAVTYFYHDGDVAKHTDFHHNDIHCNLNFIIRAEDADAMTFFELEDGMHCYSSQENCAFLLASNFPHYITNSKPREILHIRFSFNYHQVKNFLLKNPIDLS